MTREPDRPALPVGEGGPALQGDDPRSAWTSLALSLPRVHALVGAGRVAEALGAFLNLPAIPRGLPSALDPRARLELGLDVFMVEAFLRRHDWTRRLDPRDAATLQAAADTMANALDIPPILTYPLYIRENPPAPERLRRFTPLAAEARFIHMHRRIEEEMERLLPLLEALPAAADPVAAIEAVLPPLSAGFRRINRCMAGFRGVERMPRQDFFEGFRPYYDSKKDAATGQVLLEGPSGLQSAGYRLLAMRIGYRDAGFDAWTDRLMQHQLPATRVALATARRERDAGRSLSGVADRILGGSQDLPPLHPHYAPQLPSLFAAALAGGYVSSDIQTTFAEQGLVLGRWPSGAPIPPWPAEAVALAPLDGARARAVEGLREIEAMIFGFQMEHAATAAVQIGNVDGTGGTSGVEFLLLATFRRAIPQLWALPTAA